MNGKTAKLLRRLSSELGTNDRTLKTLWKTTPRTGRPQLRTNVKNQLKDIRASKTVAMPDGVEVTNPK